MAARNGKYTYEYKLEVNRFSQSLQLNTESTFTKPLSLPCEDESKRREELKRERETQRERETSIFVSIWQPSWCLHLAVIEPVSADQSLLQSSAAILKILC